MNVISSYYPLASRVEGVAIDETGQKLVNLDNTFTLDDEKFFIYSTLYAKYVAEFKDWEEKLQTLKRSNADDLSSSIYYLGREKAESIMEKAVRDLLAKKPLPPLSPGERRGKSFEEFPITTPDSVRMELGEFFFRLSRDPLVYFFHDLMESTGLADKIREFNSRYSSASSWTNPHFSAEDIKLIKLCGIIYFTLTKNGIGEAESYEKRLYAFFSYAPPIIPYIRSGLVPEYAWITVADFSERIEGLATITLKEKRRSVLSYEPYFIQSSHDSDRRIDFYWVRENKVKFFESLTNHYNRDIWMMLIDLPVEEEIGYFVAIDIHRVLTTNGYRPSGAMLKGAFDGLDRKVDRKNFILLLLGKNVPLDGGRSKYGRDAEQFSPVSSAVMMNDTDVLEKILEKGGDINESDKYGNRPINGAISLVGAIINSDDYERVKKEKLLVATRTFNLVVSYKPEVNYSSKMGRTILVDAIDLNLTVDHIRKLLKLGANPNIEGAIFSVDPRIKRGTVMTPLALANFKGMRDISNLLIEYGATQ